MAAEVFSCELASKDDNGNRLSSRSTTSGSSMAPTEFQLSESFDSSSQAAVVSVALERCLLCAGSRRSFYCKLCVRSGDFIHSRLRHHPFQQAQQHLDVERYDDKLKRYIRLKREREKIVERFQAALTGKLKVSHQKTEMQLREQRIQLLKEALNKTSSAVAAASQRLEELSGKTVMIQQRAQRHEQERVKILAYLSKMSDNIDHHLQKHSAWIEELSSLRRQHITDLITYIFPITEIPAKSASEVGMRPVEETQPSTVSLLADARRMAYVKGRWVYTDSGYEQLYRIVAPTLPGSGDFSLAMVDNRETLLPAVASGGIGSQLECNPSRTITAALSFTAQLVSLVAHYLDIILPRRQDYSEFCMQELTERRFNRAVLRLNHNILSLCFRQTGINLAGIDPHNTIVNLLTVLNCPELGNNSGCSAIDNDEMAAVVQSIESSLLANIEDTSKSGETDSDMSDVDDSGAFCGRLARDKEQVVGWEHVPITLPEVDVSVTARTASPSYFAESHTAVTSIVSSAASSVASLWRWGRTSDK